MQINFHGLNLVPDEICQKFAMEKLSQSLFFPLFSHDRAKVNQTIINQQVQYL